MKKFFAIMLAFALIFSLVGCADNSNQPGDDQQPSKPQAQDPQTPASQGDEEQTTGKDTIVIAESSEWYALDLAQVDGSSFCHSMVVSPLVDLDQEGKLCPSIASEIAQSEDGLTIALTIPEGMYFSTGEQVDPEDVIASLQRFQKISPFADTLETVVDMQEDGRNVVLTLSEYSSDFNVSISSCFIDILDKSEIESMSDDELLWGAHPYGQYYVEEFVPGAGVTLKANPGFVTYNPMVENKGVAKIETVVCRFISDAFSMANAMNVGDVDYIVSISYDGAQQVTLESANKEIASILPSLSYLLLNTNADSPCCDVNVRKAIARAIDRDVLCDVINGMGSAVYSLTIEGQSNYCQEASDYFKATYSPDVDAAKELLAAAGWTDTDGDGYADKDGQKLSLRIVANKDGTTEDAVTQALQIMLKEVGIDLQIELYAVYGHYGEIGAQNYDIGLCSWGYIEPLLLYNDGMADLTWHENCGIEGYYELLSALKTTVDYDERTEIVGQIEKIYSDNMITIPLQNMLYLAVDAGNVAGIARPGNGNMYFNDMCFTD